MAQMDRRELLAGGAAGLLAGALPLEAGALERVLAGPAALPRPAARALRSAVRGPVLFPRTPGYNSARLVYNSRYSGVRPEAVVQPRDTRDVQAVVRWANRYKVRLTARSGGHSYAGYSTIANGVVVDLSRMQRRPGVERQGHGRPRRPAHRRAAHADPPGPVDAVGLLSLGGHRRPDARRRPRARRPALRADHRQPGVGHHRHRRRTDPPGRRRHATRTSTGPAAAAGEGTSASSPA